MPHDAGSSCFAPALPSIDNRAERVLDFIDRAEACFNPPLTEHARALTFVCVLVWRVFLLEDPLCSVPSPWVSMAQ